MNILRIAYEAWLGQTWKDLLGDFLNIVLIMGLSFSLLFF
jgi:hypothetical protein